MFHALDLATGEPLSILEWTLDASNADPFQLDRNVSGVEQEMNYLVKLRHRNLLHHLNVRHRAAGRTRVLQILQEHVAGVNVSSLLVCEGAVADVDLVRHVAGGVLGALEFLHRNNVVHKQVGDACVYIKEDGNGCPGLGEPTKFGVGCFFCRYDQAGELQHLHAPHRSGGLVEQLLQQKGGRPEIRPFRIVLGNGKFRFRRSESRSPLDPSVGPAGLFKEVSRPNPKFRV